MPVYEFRCKGGHEFERYLRLAEFDYAQRCECGEIAEQIVKTAPSVIGFESASATRDEKIYRKHNVTRRIESFGVTALPNSPGDGCKCGNCGAHQKRNGITAVAEPGKDR